MKLLATMVLVLLALSALVLGFVFAGDSPRRRIAAGLCVLAALVLLGAAVLVGAT